VNVTATERFFYQITFIYRIIIGVVTIDQMELGLLAESHKIVQKRITDMNVSIKYHHSILGNKIGRLEKKEYYKTLKDRYDFISRNQ